jgi:hypothetical protein
MRSTDTVSSGASCQRARDACPRLQVVNLVSDSTCLGNIGRLQSDVGEKCAYMGHVVKTGKTMDTSFKSSSGRVDRFPPTFCRVAS